MGYHQFRFCNQEDVFVCCYGTQSLIRTDPDWRYRGLLELRVCCQWWWMNVHAYDAFAGKELFCGIPILKKYLTIISLPDALQVVRQKTWTTGHVSQQTVLVSFILCQQLSRGLMGFVPRLVWKADNKTWMCKAVVSSGLFCSNLPCDSQLVYACFVDLIPMSTAPPCIGFWLWLPLER